MRITIEDREKVAAAIRAAEATTDGEINAVIAASSDTYNDVVLHWALLVALLPLAISAAWPGLLHWGASLLTSGGWEEPSLRAMLTLLLLKTALVFLVARWVIGIASIRMAVIPHATKARRVRRRAIMLFRAGTEQRTATRTGVLLYVSIAEHRAEIVADASIHSKVAPEAWGEAMAALIAEIAQGRPGEGMAAAIGRIGTILSAHFPHTGTDPNEMPDRLIEL